ncbi:MAG: type II toxin-antitoxin system VapC family toxin [Rhodoglobus sp.]
MIYLDSCILIYAIEDDAHRGASVRTRLEAVGETVVAISPLVAMECTVGPLRTGDLALRDVYMSAFDSFRMLPLTTEIFLRAAELRAANGLATPDSLHLAAAQLSGCTELWTNDSRLARAAHGLAIDVIEGA